MKRKAKLFYSPVIGEVVPTVPDVGLVRIVMGAAVVVVIIVVVVIVVVLFVGSLRRVVVG